MPASQPYRKPNVEDILRKYRRKIEGQMNSSDSTEKGYSREYVKFKKEMAPELNRYERWARSLGSIIKLNVSEKDEEKIRRHIKIAHLDIEPWQALTLSVTAFLAVFFATFEGLPIL